MFFFSYVFSFTGIVGLFTEMCLILMYFILLADLFYFIIIILILY